MEFGVEYTMVGDIRVQKIYGDDGTAFPSVFLPESPIEVSHQPSDSFQPELPEAPMRIVVAEADHGKRQVANALQNAEGKHVELTFVLSVDVKSLMEPVKLVVRRIKIISAASNSS